MWYIEKQKGIEKIILREVIWVRIDKYYIFLFMYEFQVGICIVLCLYWSVCEDQEGRKVLLEGEVKLEILGKNSRIYRYESERGVGYGGVCF